MATPLWLAMGVLVGGMHAASLWHTTRRANGILAATGLLRLLVVGVILTTAAVAGGVVPVCAGWAIGFPAVAALLYARGRTS